MTVSVVVVTYNTVKETLESLKSIFASTGLASFEVIVVDNDSSDDTVEKAKLYFPKVKLIANRENRGFAAAVNQGIKASTGRFVMLLNPDATVEPETIAKLLNYLQKHPTVGIAGPKILNVDGSIQRSVEPLPTLKHALYEFLLLSRIFSGNKEFGNLRMAGFDFNKTQLVDKLTGAALLIRREIFDRYGLLDERYFLYYEETDLMLKLHRDGILQVTFYPDAVAHHHLNKSLGAVSAKTVNYSLSSMNHYFRKNYGPVYNLLINLLTFSGAVTNGVLIALVAVFSRQARRPLQWYLQVLWWYLSLRFM